MSHVVGITQKQMTAFTLQDDSKKVLVLRIVVVHSKINPPP